MHVLDGSILVLLGGVRVDAARPEGPEEEENCRADDEPLWIQVPGLASANLCQLGPDPIRMRPFIQMRNSGQYRNEQKGANRKGTHHILCDAPHGDCLLYTSPSPRDGLLSR